MRKKILFYCISVLILLLVIEGLAFLGFKLMQKQGAFFVAIDPPKYLAQIQETFENEHSYIIYHPVLGWSITPNTMDKTKHYQSNSQQLRANREYSLKPAENVMRIGTFGDSFTHGDEVHNNETWQFYLEGLLGDQTEVLNFGIPGQSPDQAYIRFQTEGVQYDSDLVILGFMPENINRLINVFKPFYSFYFPFSKPRYLKRGDEIELVPNPLGTIEEFKRAATDHEWALSKLTEHDYWYKHSAMVGPLDFLNIVKVCKTAYYLYYRVLSKDSPYTLSLKLRPTSEAFFILKSLTFKMHREVEKLGKKFMVIVFPTRKDILKFKAGDTKRYQPYLDELSAAGIVHFDFLDHLENVSADEIYGRTHYNAKGNELLAKALKEFLLHQKLVRQ